MNKEEKVDKEFRNLIGLMNDKQFWEYIATWYDCQSILDIMNEWDTDTKEQAIKDIKKIMNRPGGIVSLT